MILEVDRSCLMTHTCASCQMPTLTFTLIYMLQLKNRRMGPTDSYIAKDLVNLLRYVSGISTHFPKNVLSELKTFISINKIKATGSNETRANCELTQVRDAPFDFWGGPRLFLIKNVCFQISVKKNICRKLVHKKIIC